MEKGWLIWIIIGAIFIVAEIFSVSFFAGPIGLACLVAALINFAGADTTWQLVGFSVTSVGLLLAVRPIWKRMMEDRAGQEVSGIDTYVGRQGKITETVDTQAETGRIKIGGESWRAVPDKNIIIEEGTLATVIRIEGSKAVVSVSENPQ
jgi:membrane protein implicated in regulation of membrane protease activity